MSYLPFAATRTSIRYGFAVGKVRVLETRVFGKATYERLLDAGSFAEQRRILSDTIYGRYLEGAETPAHVEAGLARALDDFYVFLDESNLPGSVVRYFRIRHDFANLKGALKARALGVPAEGLFAGLGTVPVEGFFGPLEDLPAPFGTLASELSGQVTTTAEGDARVDERSEPSDADLALIDFEVDRAMFAALAAAARESKSRYLQGLAALEIDIGNLKTFLRARASGLSQLALGERLFVGGGLPIDELEELYALPLSDAIARLSQRSVLSGVHVAELDDPSRVDVIADNVVVSYLRAARAVPVGPEPVIAYVLARSAEVAAVRTILIGTLSGLTSEQLRARLRDVYV